MFRADKSKLTPAVNVAEAANTTSRGNRPLSYCKHTEKYSALSQSRTYCRDKRGVEGVF